MSDTEDKKSDQIKPYEYFDTPVGQDVFKKLWCVMKPMTLWATGFSFIDVMTLSHPKGYLPTLGRMAYIASPILGSSATFVCVSNALANIRKKDDYWNWFASGFAAGSVFGLWKRNMVIGCNMGLLFGLMAVVKKNAVDNGYTLLLVENNIPDMAVWTYDCSLMKERPKGYVTSAADLK